MRTPEAAEEAESTMLGVHQWTRGLVLLSVLCVHGVVVAHLWGDWRRLALLSLCIAVTAPVNLLLPHRDFLYRTHVAENLRTLVALGGTLLYGHLAHWYFPVWLLCVFNCLWADNSLGWWNRLRLYGSLMVLVGAALVDGAPVEVAVGIFLTCGVILVLSRARLYVLSTMTQRLAQRRDELQQALAELDLMHRRAREQERLSSLGMLAAGIAHEVNNPMSYVKSNLCALQQDLQALQELPPSLREYVAEVLPETLEGVNRVCAIVADLRRFARGDPEALIEYDLNEEVQTALRITHGRMKAYCEVEVSLEPLPPMLGHPRQISQVVVNLLLNAAQAMKVRGKVYVSTRTDGVDDVVLTVRDTGEGMTPEVLGHLFQPFFTTREEGEGTGMGLAVVHGIVTSHGGRIRVESEPSLGSTFSVRLPRVPPLKFVSPPSLDEPLSPPASKEPSQGQTRLH